jgi:hypothetical protein
MKTCKGVQECVETRELLAEYRGGVCLATSTVDRITKLEAKIARLDAEATRWKTKLVDEQARLREIIANTRARAAELEEVLREICDIYWSLPVPGPRDWDPLFERARDLLEKQR